MNSAQIETNFNNGYSYKALLQKYEDNLPRLATNWILFE